MLPPELGDDQNQSNFLIDSYFEIYIITSMEQENYFAISKEGLALQQAGKAPWELAREIVANAFDEEVTQVDVMLEQMSPKKVMYTVVDNGPGFSDLSHAWTLYAPTKKQSNPSVRGRFNFGEKSIICLASSALIETTSGSVHFAQGRRSVLKLAKRDCGTKVVLHLPWNREQVEEVRIALKSLQPPEGVRYTVNLDLVSPQPTVRTISPVELETQLADDEGVLKSFWRKTGVVLTKPLQGVPFLKELGIPIMKIDCPYSVDVQQKVPLSVDRDNVKPGYLKDVYAEVLNVCIKDGSMNDENISDPWVRIATTDPRCLPETVQAVKDRRYGQKALLWSSDVLANERAREAGYTIIHPKTLEGEEKQVFESAGLVHTTKIFGITPGKSEAAEVTPDLERVKDLCIRLGKQLLGIDVGVRFYKMENDYSCAHWSGTVISFNVLQWGELLKAPLTPRLISTIVHEFAHHGPKGPTGEPHSREFWDRYEDLMGRTVLMALEDPKLFVL